MMPQQPDKVIILVDVSDPLTRDREFVNMLKYSPYIIHMDEMSERNRQLILKQSQEADDGDPRANKYAIDLRSECMGEFVMQFVASPTHQRALVFLDYSVEPLPPPHMRPDEIADLADEQGLEVSDLMDEFEDGLVHLYELRTGSALKNLNEDEDESEDDEEDYGEDDEPRAKASSKSEPKVLLLDSDGPTAPDEDLHVAAEGDDEMMDMIEDINLNGQGFVIGAPRSIH